MKIIFLHLSGLFLVIMLLCCYFLSRKKTTLAKTLLIVNIAAIFSTLFYNLSITYFPYKISLAFNSLYYASIHWLLIFFLYFTITLTDTPVNSKIMIFFKHVWKIILAGDTLSLLSNPFTENAFSIYPIKHNDVFFCWGAEYHFAFHMHLLFSYILVAIVVYLLIKNTIITNKFYRNKFFTIFLILLSVVFLNLLFLVTDMELDFSILTYCLFSMASAYFAMYSVPRKIENAMLQLVSDNLNSGVLCFDLSKKCIYSNSTGRQYFPIATDLDAELTELIAQKKDFLIRNINISKNEIPVTLYEEFQVLTDSKGQKLGYYIRFNDITNELNAIAEEHHRSTHDTLTGLYNRETFIQKAEQLFRDDPDTQRYFVVTDIKNFKLVNDLFGTSFGDRLLKAQTEVLLLAGGPGIIHGRFSGDKFAMIIPKARFNPEKAQKNTQRISYLTDSLNYKLNIRIGVYEISDPNEKIISMYDKANLAIKNMSSDYSSMVSYYTPQLMENAMAGKSVISAFENALADDQFEMYLQPQVCCKDESVLGAEALVRWNHPDKGILYPAAFIPVLEDTGYLFKLDQYIWTKAAQTLAKWKTTAPDLYIAVNISANDFYYIDIYRFFTNLVNEYDIPPSRLKLEITETALMHDLKTHKKILSKLQAKGFSIEMDDFGSGYSSLNMLKNVDVDILKIDMAFLRQTKNEDRSRIILSSIVKMAQQLNMKIVTEGVEDENQAEFLKSLGCDIIQGFLYSRPITLRDFETNYIEGHK